MANPNVIIGYVLSRRLSAKKYQTVVVSPRSYFVFTPLLAGTAVGTLEFRTTLEPVRNRRYPNIEFIQAWADDIDFDRKIVRVEESVVDVEQSAALGDRHGDYTDKEERQERTAKRRQGTFFDVAYDKLVVSVGCYNQTFSTEGVKENAFFLKDVADTRKIRKRILECYEIAALPTTSDQLKRQLLHFAVVGGGPTGMEFSAELNDLVHEDMLKLYPDLETYAKITIYDVAPKVLSMFDKSLVEYAMETFKREKIDIKTEHHVQELRQGVPNTQGEDIGNVTDTESCFTLKTKEEGDIGVGMCVWTTGNMMNPFVQKALRKCYKLPKASASVKGSDHSRLEESVQDEDWIIKKDGKSGAMLVDDHLRVQLQTALPQSKEGDGLPGPKASAFMKNVFAIGDNSMLDSGALPATAQTANQQALWLGKHLNKDDIETATFSFKNMGIMAYLGNARGLLQTGHNNHITGRSAWLIWRGAYVTMSVSWRNKILIPIYWLVFKVPSRGL